MAEKNRFSLWRKALSASVGRLASPEDESLEGLEERLLAADLGPSLASDLVAAIVANKKAHKDTPRRLILAQALLESLRPAQGALPALPESSAALPLALLLIGANGSGKTTTTAKLAQFYQGQGLRVLIVACDSFRAAASGQLAAWAERLNVAFRSAPEGADPAALAFAGMEAAVREGYQVVLFDSAGRLDNQAPLMDELAKMKRALVKSALQATGQATGQTTGQTTETGGLEESDFLTTLLLLDASLGGAAVVQAQRFSQTIGVSGLVVTKLDGTALGGAVARAVEATGLPILAVGLGEGADDLRPFQADEFVAALLGLEGEHLARFHQGLSV